MKGNMKSSQINRNERPMGIYVPKGRRRLNDSSANSSVSSIDMMQELSICSGSDEPSKDHLEGNVNNKIKVNDNDMIMNRHKKVTVFNEICSDGKVRQGNIIPRIYNAGTSGAIIDSSALIVANEVMSNNCITHAQETAQQSSSANVNSNDTINTINFNTDINSTSSADTKNSIGNHHVIRQSDRPIGIYIPKGRRQLLKSTKAMDDVFGDDNATYDDHSSNSAIATDSGQGGRKKASSAFEMIHSSIVSSDANSYWTHRGDKIERVSNHCTESPYDASSSSGTDAFDDDEYVSSCCMTLIGLSLSTELSDVARNSICSNYVSSGGIVKWMSSHDCLVVYRSEKSALSSMATSNSASGQYKLRRLRDNLQIDKDAFIVAAREILRSMDKPDRDATVATRLIGAALGIKLKSSGSTSKSPAYGATASSSSSSSTSASTRKKTKSPPRVDAWG